MTDRASGWPDRAEMVSGDAFYFAEHTTSSEKHAGRDTRDV